MKLIIDGTLRTLRPLPNFRATHNLPETFSMAYFEPKDDTGRGRMDTDGHQALEILRRNMISSVPETIALDNLLTYADALGQVFRNDLRHANAKIGLSVEELDFAAGGMSNLLLQSAYSLIKLWQEYRDAAQVSDNYDPEAVYQAWLNDSVRVSSTQHRFAHDDVQLTAQVIYNAFGRVGLRVTHGANVHYLLDASLACPAANYIENLSSEVGSRMARSFVGTTSLASE